MDFRPSSSSAGGGGRSSVSKYVGPSTYTGRGGSGTGRLARPPLPLNLFCEITRSRFMINALVWRGSEGEESFVVSLRFGGAGLGLAGDPCPAAGALAVLVGVPYGVATTGDLWPEVVGALVSVGGLWSLAGTAAQEGGVGNGLAVPVAGVIGCRCPAVVVALVAVLVVLLSTGCDGALVQ